MAYPFELDTTMWKMAPVKNCVRLTAFVFSASLKSSKDGEIVTMIHSIPLHTEAVGIHVAFVEFYLAFAEIPLLRALLIQRGICKWVCLLISAQTSAMMTYP